MKDDFLKKLLATFRIEADEHIRLMSSLLVEIEKVTDVRKRTGALEKIFREVHSLKGAARTVNMKEIESACQSLESVFSELKTNRIALTPELFDLLHETIDCLHGFLSSGKIEWEPAEESKVLDLTRQLQETAEGMTVGTAAEDQGTAAEDQGTAAGDKVPGTQKQEVGGERISVEPAAMETVRISTAKLDSLLLLAEELLSVKLAIGQRVTDLLDMSVMLDSWKKEWSKIYPNVRAVRHQVEKSEENNRRRMNLQISAVLEFLGLNQNYIKLLESKLGALAKATDCDRRSHGKMVDDLLYDMKRVLMLPFSTALEVFPKLVRDLSREQGKDVEFVMRGEEVEIDRRILEEMKDPLIHIVRNCIDHGIENQKERLKKKKPAQGSILIAISPRNSSGIEITISDDGEGIDAARVRAGAIKNGILSPEDAERLTEAETLSLIYQSGISTSPIVTEVSGRGLGLAIVRERVEKLGGAIFLDTRPGSGTTFRILLPMTLAAVRGVLVRAGEQRFVIPAASVEKAVRINHEEIKTVENRETIQFNGQTIPLVRLDDVLGIPREVSAGEPAGGSNDGIRGTAVVLTSADRHIAFTVDEITGEQEILVKGLGKQLSRVWNVAGSTISGSGDTVLILHVPDLMETAVGLVTISSAAAGVSEEVERKEKSILVVEDSITARTLLKNILESAGYNVRTAVDGIDGFTTLKEGAFDLVVSDVDMPRMNGFDLTAKIRADKRVSEIPVVLVTALQSPEDREHGINVGASAYIVKSNFDQSNLLEVIRRLM